MSIAAINLLIFAFSELCIYLVSVKSIDFLIITNLKLIKMSNTNKPNAVFWVIGIIALIWNIMGVGAYLAQAYMTDEALTLLPEGDQNFYNELPAWVTGAFAIAVFAGLLGCIALLMRKKIAILLFTLSLLGVLAQQVFNFFVQDYIELSGTRMIMPILLIIISFFLMWYAKAQKSSGLIS